MEATIDYTFDIELTNNPADMQDINARVEENEKFVELCSALAAFGKDSKKDSKKARGALARNRRDQRLLVPQREDSSDTENSSKTPVVSKEEEESEIVEQTHEVEESETVEEAEAFAAALAGAMSSAVAEAVSMAQEDAQEDEEEESEDEEETAVAGAVTDAISDAGADVEDDERTLVGGDSDVEMAEASEGEEGEWPQSLPDVEMADVLLL